MSERVFKLDYPLMHGDDVRAWQRWLVDKFKSWDIDYELKTDGIYGEATRAATASMCRAWGIANASETMAKGVTPELRIKLRNNQRTADERAAFDSRQDYREALARRFGSMHVCYPVPNLITDDWGWHPGVHDGIDLVAPWKQPLLAICTGKVVRVSASGWWGFNPTPSPGHPISDGDGIVILECQITAGPFKPGLHFGYGHAENAVIKEGAIVKAGQTIAHIGFARAAHTHFMVNDDKPVDGFYRGVGDRDPAPFLDYAKSHS